MSWKPERSKLKRPIYLSLAEQLEKDIAAGFLLPGTKLPPQRELADFLDISFTRLDLCGDRQRHLCGAQRCKICDNLHGQPDRQPH